MLVVYQVLFQGLPVVAGFGAFGDAVEFGRQAQLQAQRSRRVFGKRRLVAALLAVVDVVLFVERAVAVLCFVVQADEQAGIALQEPGDEGGVARVLRLQAGGDAVRFRPVGAEDGVA